MKNSEQTEVQSPERDTVGTFLWRADVPPRENYENLAKALSMSPDLFRRANKHGLLLLTPAHHVEEVSSGEELWAVIVDRLNVVVLNASGKPSASGIRTQHLNAMLRTEVFLKHFLPVDDIASRPIYLADFRLSEKGYNQGPDGRNYLYIGPEPRISRQTDCIDRFLDVMDFASNADRTNTVAAALTVMLRNHWPGAKPIILATATKSHAGKETIISFATGIERHVPISYQATDWALERCFVGAVKTVPDVGVIAVENARLGGRNGQIASAYLERFATDPEPFLFSTGTGKPTRRANDIVIAISTNYGLMSEDLLNRGLPIHMTPKGNVADRVSPIGNPRFEYLPQHCEEIAAELRGMIEAWKEAGMPPDMDAKHSSSAWAQTVGGILLANGYSDFLANYEERKTADDPVRDGLAILGAERPDQWLRPGDWAVLAGRLGLVKRVIPAGDRDSHARHECGIGKVLTAHLGETFTTETESERLKLLLEKSRPRLNGRGPRVHYRFKVLEREPLPED